MLPRITLVTGLWDLGRGELEDFGRSYEHYMECFEKLLGLDVHFHIFCSQKDKDRLREIVGKKAVFTVKELSEFKTWFPFWKPVQSLRANPDWYRQADWLMKSPQSKLEYYNPVVMSKFFMLNDAAIQNIYNSEYLFWIDAGITNTVRDDLLAHIRKIPKWMKSQDMKFLMLKYPYENVNEVHGFKTKAFEKYLSGDLRYVCRGGFFGGKRDAIKELNGNYYGWLHTTLYDGYMGTEENILTLLATHNYDLISTYPLEENGLVYKFFEELEDFVVDERPLLTQIIEYNRKKPSHEIKTSLYVLTYNSPNQFDVLLNSLDSVNNIDFLNMPRKILVDNSTDLSTYEAYHILCGLYGFEHIKKGENIGICGGRQFVAEHFMESDSEYYVFLEDDMFFNGDTIENLYEKSLLLTHLHKMDYLKLTFQEFYGNNEDQWAWHNVPEAVRNKYFEGVTERPKIENFSKVRYKDLTMRVGPYYYCNWPAWFSRMGNQKVFLDKKWMHPHEQTWMSHVFQLQMDDKIKAGVLEISPVVHDRFDHYPAEERIES
jgi:hypothetical protein